MRVKISAWEVALPGTRFWASSFGPKVLRILASVKIYMSRRLFGKERWEIDLRRNLFISVYALLTYNFQVGSSGCLCSCKTLCMLCTSLGFVACWASA